MIRTYDGGHRDLQLGKYTSPESRIEETRQIAVLAAPYLCSRDRPPHRLTIDELAIAFMRHAANSYRHPDGRPLPTTSARRSARPKPSVGTARPPQAECGDRPTAKFSPIALKAVLHQMIDRGRCRSGLNTAVERVKRVVKWGVGEKRRGRVNPVLRPVRR